jgi:hypothetical protein
LIGLYDDDHPIYLTDSRAIDLINDWALSWSSNLIGKNIGSGIGIYYRKNGNCLEFKSLLAGSGIVITETVNNEITISANLGVTSIDDLGDVDTISVPPTAGEDFLMWNGVNWVPASLSGGGY